MAASLFPSSGVSRATLRLTLACDNRCAFCAQRGLETPADASAPADAFPALRATADELTFVGGEPTLDPGLAGLVAGARAAGFRRIGLQTNGRRLADGACTAALAAAGLTDVHLSLHGADAPLHDYHAGVEGAFDKALLALGAARTQRLDAVVTTVVTRSNFRHLAPLPRLLKGAGVSAWSLAFPRAAGAAAAAFDRLMPRLALATPFVLHALDLALKAGLPAFVQGAPACLLGPFATRLLPEPPRAFGAACTGCAARAGCPGVDPAYLRRFGGDELRSRDAFAPVPGHEALRRMFVGTGELAPGTFAAHLGGPSVAAPAPAAAPVLTSLTLGAK